MFTLNGHIFINYLKEDKGFFVTEYLPYITLNICL